MAKSAPKLNLNAQQIKAIKASRAGQVPKFISDMVYKTPEINSVGGMVKTKKGYVGGTIGYDKKAKKAFGSANVNGRVIGKFGPQGE